ncbi:MAG: circadian clock protein KaiA [Cyanobacteria bacterium P01_C01_bin.72]
MSDFPDNHSSSETLPAKLQICLYSTQKKLCDLASQLLDSNCYELKCYALIDDLADYIVSNSQQIDCLILRVDEQLDSLVGRLCQAEIFLPTVLLESETVSVAAEKADDFAISITEASDIYHQAEIRLYPTQFKEISSYISLAINKFVSLAPNLNDEEMVHTPLTSTPEAPKMEVKRSLKVQQRRLTDKLKERLSYWGFFYKRNSDSFWGNLSDAQQGELADKISQSYRQILLAYFDQDVEINKLIDEFVDRAFFADISTSQILEIHMDLMDDFAHQLRIEGRNDDILLDYRLPLIDIIAHLCEMYRRSIPDADNSMNLLFAVE